MEHAQDLPGSVDAAVAAKHQQQHSSSDSLYQELVRQHHSLKIRLHQLATLTHLTTDQQVEEVTLKKKKLAIKDQMASLLSASRH